MREALLSSFVDTLRFREVLYRLLSRDLKIKYKRTYLGYVWSLLNPILQLTVLTIVFSRAMQLGMKDYTLYLFSGLLAWTFLSSSLTSAATSLLENENFLKKIYMPKLIFPLSRVLLRLFDFLFSLVALLLIGLLLGFTIRPTVFLVPVAILSLTLFTLGLGVVLSVLTVYFRDVEYLLGVFLQLFYFGTPIFYPPEIIPEPYRVLVKLNPLYGQINLFQDLMYYGTIPSLSEWAVAFGTGFLILAVGALLLSWLGDDLIFRM